MRRCLHVLVAAVILVVSRASQPKGDQNTAIAAVREARDELKVVLQQLGEQQEQINQLTEEVAELRAAKKGSTIAPARTNSNVSVPVAQNQGATNKTAGPRKVLTSLRATAERAEHVLVEQRPRTPWWAEKQHTRGPAEFPGGGGYYGESNTDPTFGRHKYYPAGWSLAPEHQPMQPYATSNDYTSVTSYNVFAPEVVAAPPAPSPVEEAVPTLPPIIENAPSPVESSALASEQSEPTKSSFAAPLQTEGVPPPPSGNDLRPKSDQLATAVEGRSEQLAKAVPLKNTMGFFGPPPSGSLPNAPASA